MAIIVNLDVMLAKRKMEAQELADKIGSTTANLSILKTGKAKAMRFSTLEAICKEVNCQPGDILEFITDNEIKRATISCSFLLTRFKFTFQEIHKSGFYNVYSNSKITIGNFVISLFNFF